MADAPIITLCTLQQVNAWGVPDNTDPDLVPTVIDSVTAELADACGRPSFFTHDTAQSFRCRPVVELGGPVQSVTSVEYRTGYNASVLDVSAYALDGDNLSFSYHVPGLLKCDYVRGWTDETQVTDALRQIAVQIVALDLKRRGRPDLRSETTQAGASTLTYDSSARSALVQRAVDLYWEWSL